MGRVDRIGVKVASGTSAAAVKASLAAQLGTTVAVAEPEARGEQGEKLLFSLRSMLVVAGSLAVIVGALIVYQAVAVSVQQRRRQFALFNAIGISRRTLVHLCLLEAALLALVAAGAGEMAGHWLGRFAAGIAGAATSEIWTPLEVSERVISPLGSALGLAIGVVVAVLAAFVAVRATFAVPTVEALRPAVIPLEDPPPLFRTMCVAAFLIAATWVIVFVPASARFLVVAVIIGSQLFAYAAMTILGPAIVSGVGTWLARWGGPTRLLWIRLAAHSLPRTPRRTGMTVAAIAAAIGMTVSLSGLVRSFENSWASWIDQHFASDLFVGSGGRVRLLAGPPMGPTVRERLLHTPGVASVEPFRVTRTQLAGEPVFLQGISVADRLAHGGLEMVQGTLEQAAPELDDGRGVLLSENLAYRLGLHRGEDLHLRTPTGPRLFRVEGIFVDYLGSLDLGAVAVSTEQLAKVWDDRFANLFRLWVLPGASIQEVRHGVLERLGRGYYAITAGEFRSALQGIWRQFFVVTWLLVAVAMLVAVIGIVNAQLATVLDRSSEIAMLRTIGVSRSDISRCILLECAVQGALGAVSGLALGTMLSAQFVTVSMRLPTGGRLASDLPFVPLLAVAVLAVGVSALAGWMPARVAGLVAPTQHSLD